MNYYLVVEYESVDIRSMQDKRPRSVPGGPREAQIVSAKSPDEALVGLDPGHYSVHTLDLDPAFAYEVTTRVERRIPS